MRAYQKRGISLASGMEIGYVAKDAKRRMWSKKGRRRSLMLGIIEAAGESMGSGFIRELEG